MAQLGAGPACRPLPSRPTQAECKQQRLLDASRGRDKAGPACADGSTCVPHCRRSRALPCGRCPSERPAPAAQGSPLCTCAGGRAGAVEGNMVLPVLQAAGRGKQRTPVAAACLLPTQAMGAPAIQLPALLPLAAPLPVLQHVAQRLGAAGVSAPLPRQLRQPLSRVCGGCSQGAGRVWGLQTGHSALKLQARWHHFSPARRARSGKPAPASPNRVPARLLTRAAVPAGPAQGCRSEPGGGPRPQAAPHARSLQVAGRGGQAEARCGTAEMSEQTADGWQAAGGWRHVQDSAASCEHPPMSAAPTRKEGGKAGGVGIVRRQVNRGQPPVVAHHQLPALLAVEGRGER